jgi:hypothetical protein
MKRCKISSDEPPSEPVYLIVRVSGLHADGTGPSPKWRIYLDPWTLAEQGVLKFSEPTYTVALAADTSDRGPDGGT